MKSYPAETECGVRKICYYNNTGFSIFDNLLFEKYYHS